MNRGSTSFPIVASMIKYLWLERKDVFSKFCCIVSLLFANYTKSDKPCKRPLHSWSLSSVNLAFDFSLSIAQESIIHRNFESGGNQWAEMGGGELTDSGRGLWDWCGSRGGAYLPECKINKSLVNPIAQYKPISFFQMVDVNSISFNLTWNSTSEECQTIRMPVTDSSHFRSQFTIFSYKNVWPGWML